MSNGGVAPCSPVRSSTSAGPSRRRESRSFSLEGILAQAVQQVASLSWEHLAVLTNEALDTGSTESAPRKLIDQVKDAITKKRVDLLPYFDREGILVDDGTPVRFGFLGRSIVAHFGVLKPNEIGRSVKDARGRLWELQKAHNRSDFKHASLILQLPRNDDVFFDNSQVEKATSALDELRAEAQQDKVEVLAVHSPPEAADTLANLAA